MMDEERRLVAAVLRRAGGEGAAHLSNQGAAQPQSPGLLPEAAHRGGHAPEAGRRPDDDRVVIGEILDLGDRRGLVELEVGRLGDFFRHVLRNALDVHLGAGRFGAFGDRVGHRFDMAIA